MSMVSSAQDDSVMAEINITPFTDVLLVLLIIFMILAAITTPPGFQKQLPKTNNSPQSNDDKNKKKIDVLVNNVGVIYIDGEKADDHTIYYLMSQAASKMGHIHVAITADAKAPYAIIIRILDAAKEANLDDVGFVTS